MNRRSFLKSGLLWLPSAAYGQFGGYRPDKPYLAKVYGQGGPGGGSGPGPLWKLLTSYWTMDEGPGSSRLDTRQRLNDLCDVSSGCGNYASGQLPTQYPQGAGILNHSAGDPTGTNGLMTTGSGGTGGADQSMSPGGTSGTPTPTNPFAFSLWFAPDATPGAGVRSAVIIKGTAGYFHPIFSGTEYFLLWGLTGSGLLSWGVSADGSSLSSTVTAAIAGTGTFHHVACGYDGVNIWMQIDNGTRLTAAVTGPIYNTGCPFSVGTTTVWYNGVSSLSRVDEMAYVNGHSFTLSEVTKLYNGGSPLPPPFQV